jgi:hypothetical protein
MFATDWIVAVYIVPVTVLAVGITFFFWWLILGNAFARVGFLPLAIGYASAAVALLLINLVDNYFEFSRRVAIGHLEETHRWSTLPGWTIYTALLSLITVLPLLAIVGMPLSAVLLRTRKMTIIIVALIALPILLLVPDVGLVVAPFLIGILVSTRSARRAAM